MSFKQLVGQEKDVVSKMAAEQDKKSSDTPAEEQPQDEKHKVSCITYE